MSKILIIPDIHDRVFWKESLNYNGKIIFLGDYLDPYSFEFDPNGKYETSYNGELVRYNTYTSRKESAIQNFKEIITFAKSNKNVFLLLGNHDCHYLDTRLNASRKDILNCKEIKELFRSNIELFHYYFLQDSLLCTHAGVTNEWLNTTGEWESIKEALNSTTLYQKFEVSSYRGGNDKYSGPLWEDVHELEGPYKDTLATDTVIKYQIFGHSMAAKKGSIIKVDSGACIDSREIFEVDTKNPENTLKIWDRKNE